MISFLYKYYKVDFENYLKTTLNDEDVTLNNILEIIARTAISLKKGGELDIEQANKRILSDFRDGKIAKITLDRI